MEISFFSYEAGQHSEENQIDGVRLKVKVYSVFNDNSLLNDPAY